MDRHGGYRECTIHSLSGSSVSGPSQLQFTVLYMCSVCTARWCPSARHLHGTSLCANVDTSMCAASRLGSLRCVRCTAPTLASSATS